MDWRLQVSCSGMWEFAVPYSNPVLLKTKNIFSVFHSIYGISSKCWTFSKKSHSSCISQISDRLRLGEASHYPAPSQNILRQSICLTVPNTSKIFMRALLSHFSITVRRNNLENISVKKFGIIGLFVNTWTANQEYPVPDCENL